MFASFEPTADIWVYEIARQKLRPLTDDGTNRWPVWINDALVAYSSTRAGPDSIFTQRWDRADEPVQLTRNDNDTHLNASSRDGTLLAVHKHNPNGCAVLSLDTMDGDAVEVTSEADLSSFDAACVATFSPDGEWYAYGSEGNVHVTRTAGSGSRIPISTNGGQFPRWRASRELFYRNGEQVVAVSLTTQPEPRPGDPLVLFEGRFAGGAGAGNFEVTADGARFVMVLVEEPEADAGSADDRIDVVLNWLARVHQQVPR